MVPDPLERVRAAYRRLAEIDRPEIWITVRPEAESLALAQTVTDRIAGNESLPLAGLVVAVKDNIDVAGLPTTAALPSSTYQPTVSAPSVARLEAAGVIVIGKTNLDQLATGLVGVRSPHGPVRAAHDPAKVSGGSSSGSAVAVALGVTDIGLGTDTAGSGRVPAAFNGIIGLKPTLGLIPAKGVVPAAPSYDTVTVFASTVDLAAATAAVMAGTDATDPTGRDWPSTAPATVGPAPRVAVPEPANLAPMSPAWRKGFDQAIEHLNTMGAEVIQVDIQPLLEAARLLYDGALVAERTYAVGHLLEDEPQGADPSVSQIIGSGTQHSAVDVIRDQQALRAYAVMARHLLVDVDALMIPTAPGHPTIAEVQAEPIAVNSWVGTYTNFVNLLDLAAIAVPGPQVDGPTGVTFVGPAFSDAALADLAARFIHQPAPSPAWSPPSTPLAVFGAHMSGQPLNWQLTGLGARLLGSVSTTPVYRLYALDTQPPKPGLVHQEAAGASITGELWAVPTGRVAEFLQHLARPMTVGKVQLNDGNEYLGFLCEPAAVQEATDISEHGSWTTYRRTLA